MIVCAIEQTINEFLLITFAETITNVSIFETITLLKKSQLLMFVSSCCSKAQRLCPWEGHPHGVPGWQLPALPPSHWRISRLTGYEQLFLTQKEGDLEPTC